MFTEMCQGKLKQTDVDLIIVDKNFGVNYIPICLHSWAHKHPNYLQTVAKQTKFPKTIIIN